MQLVGANVQALYVVLLLLPVEKKLPEAVDGERDGDRVR